MVILPLSVVLVGATFLANGKAVAFLSRSLISQTIGETEAELRRFFEPVNNLLEVMLIWGRSGVLDVDQPVPLQGLLPPLLTSHRQISTALIADGRGHEVMILQAGSGWRSRHTRADEWGRRTQWAESTAGGAEPVSYWKALDYDPRTRPWYQGATARLRGRGALTDGVSLSELVYWTEPYTFFTTREPGITAAAGFSTASGNESVVGFDVSLSDISAFTAGLEVGEHGGVMVLTDEGRVIGLPRFERFKQPAARRGALLKRLVELDWPLGKDADRAFASQPDGEKAPVRFASGGTLWWGQHRPFQLAPERRLWIAVVVPEQDLLGNLRHMPFIVLTLTLLVTAVAAWRALVVARRFSQPIEELVRETDRIRMGDFEDPQPVVSSVKEIRRLVSAQERMRSGLKSLMKLERDLQLARQIQQAALPARLPVLPGFQIDAWSEPAEETGGDTFDVVGYAHEEGGPVTLTPERADRAVLLLADATGHGIGPALSATEVRAMLRMAVRSGEGLEQMARKMNEQLCADLKGGRFITAWLAELDAHAGTLRTFSAGQAPILHYRSGLDTTMVNDADAPPLGILEELDVRVNEPLVMQPGDLVAVMSDGVFEAVNPSGEQFGLERAVQAISSQAAASASEALSALKQVLAEFTVGTPAGDDRTAIVIKRV